MNTNVTMIPVAQLHPHPDNPRKDLGDITELTASIKANGVLQNLTVVPRANPDVNYEKLCRQYYGNPTEENRTKLNQFRNTDGYTVIIGHRRLAAAKAAGLMELPCIVVEDMTLEEQISTMMTENVQRSDLTVYEEAEGFQMMMDFGNSVEQVADKAGFSESTIRRRVKLLSLDREEFKKSAKRGATLADFALLDKLDTEEAKNEVLKSVGTNNFRACLDRALREQKDRKTMNAIPLGNNNYGKHSSEQFYKAIPTFIDTGAGGKTGRTATGTGPLTWYHDNSPSGIADPVGDVWEWAGGVRTVYGELQVMANNNGADAANSQGVSSTKWMAISADDGSYITPDGSGTTANSVKLDIVSRHIQWSKTITTRNKDSDWPSCSFAAITCDSTISDAAKLVLQCLGMLPYKATDLCAKAGHQCWFRNLDAERAFFSGGGWGSSSCGLASFHGSNPRSLSWTFIGFRAAFVKLPTA